jgi:hypothetical protein
LNGNPASFFPATVGVCLWLTSLTIEPGNATMSQLLLVRLPSLLVVLGLLALAGPGGRADYSAEQFKADIKLFQDAKLPYADADLLDFFRKRLVNPQDQARIKEAINKLASKSFKEREQASSDLIKHGPPALPALRKAVKGAADLEIKKRCQRCIDSIEKQSPNALVMAAARLLNARQTPGACAALIDYVAFAPDSIVEEELFSSIYQLALGGAKLEVFPPLVKAGRLDPVLAQNLHDPEQARRAVAALVIGQFGTDAQRQQVKKLLADTDPHVRFRAAQGLLAAGDPSGVPVLVALLEKGPLHLALQAEDMLGLAAKDNGPATPLSEKTETRQKCHEAWREWWNKNQASIDVTTLDVGSPFGSLHTRAGNGAVQFLKAFLKVDVALLTKVTDVPFIFFDAFIFQTREEFDDFIKMNYRPNNMEEPKIKVGKIISAAEYLKGAAEQERAFLEAARPAQVHVVNVRLYNEGGGARALGLFIRISGGRAKCIGFASRRAG